MRTPTTTTTDRTRTVRRPDSTRSASARARTIERRAIRAAKYGTGR